jgi:hypothetical protein
MANSSQGIAADLVGSAVGQRTEAITLLVVDKPLGAALHVYPSSDAPIVRNLSCSAEVTIHGRNAGWYAVDAPGGLTGWIGGARVQAANQAGPDCMGAVTYQVGESVTTFVPTGCLSLRGSPSRQAPYAHCVANGHRYLISGGPISVAGEDWFNIWSASTGAGWSLAQYLAVAPSAAADQGPGAGQSLVITKRFGPALHIYPDSDAPVSTVLPCGSALSTIAQANGWYEVSENGGRLVGWVGGARAAPVSSGAINCGGAVTYQIGSATRTFVPAGCLSLRGAPSRQATYAHCVPNGHVYLVTSGPISTAGEDWLGVWSASTGPGWSLAQYLTPTGRKPSGNSLGHNSG